MLERVEQVAKRIGPDGSESSEKIRGIVSGVTVRFISIQAIDAQVSNWGTWRSERDIITYERS